MSASNKKKLRKEQNAAQLTEKQQKEQKQAKKLRMQTIAFVAAVSLVLAVGLGILGVTAYKNSGIIERATTALTIGDLKLSNADLSYFYIDLLTSSYNDWYQDYGESTASYLAALYGLNVLKPLDEQEYINDPTMTYADYFVDLAVQDAVSTYALYNIAIANGFRLSDETVAAIDTTITTLKAAATRTGYRGINEYLKVFYGNGANEQNFRQYLEVTETATAYELEAYNGFTYTESDLEAYDSEHFDELSSYSYDSIYLSVNSFIECTADEDDTEHEHTEQELTAAQNAAKNAADSIVAAKPKTAEALNKAIQKLEPYKESTCTENVDVLYTDISNIEIAEWIKDSSRKVGDTIIFTNDTEIKDEDGNTVTKVYGYTVAVYQGRNDNYMKLVNVRHILNAYDDLTTDEFGDTTYSAEAVIASEADIEAIQQAWLSAGGTEEAFIKLVEEKSQDSASVDNGGLYENVYPGQMVTAFEDWCFDESRQPGDYGIVATDYGHHLMYFVGYSDTTYRNFMIENNLRNADYQAWYTENIESAQYTVHNTSKLDTGYVFASEE